MRTFLLPFAALALVSASALVMPLAPRANATVSLAPASTRATVDATSTVELTGLKCAHRRVCRPGRGCAWRKVCKRW
jgi:hypothetical protein